MSNQLVGTALATDQFLFCLQNFIMCQFSKNICALSLYTILRLNVTFIQTEAHRRPQVPLEVVPRTPPEVAADVNPILQCLVQDLCVIKNGLLPEQIAGIAYAILCNDNGILVFVPVSIHTGAQSLRVIFPHVVVRTTELFHF